MENKYKTLFDFKKDYPNEYKYLWGKNLLEQLCKDMNWEYKERFLWTKEKCLKEAFKYNTTTEWQKYSNGSKKSARKNGWFEECTAHMEYILKPAGYWTKENCLKEALKYKTRQEWAKTNVTSYVRAKKHNWLNECIVHMIETRKLPGYWNKENCLKEAFKYQTYGEWQKNNSSSYNSAKKNGWYEECTAHMVKKPKTKILLTFELCMVDALKYQTKKEWLINSGFAYNWAKRNKVYTKCTAHMIDLHTPSDYWTKERCMEEGVKYKNKTKWYKNNNGSYKSAKKNGWLDECTVHMGYMVKPNGYWTLERCQEEALKYQTKSEWSKSKGSSYAVALKNNWYEECIKHMEKDGK
jgi:hypothetical protein